MTRYILTPNDLQTTKNYVFTELREDSWFSRMGASDQSEFVLLKDAIRHSVTFNYQKFDIERTGNFNKVEEDNLKRFIQNETLLEAGEAQLNLLFHYYHQSLTGALVTAINVSLTEDWLISGSNYTSNIFSENGKIYLEGLVSDIIISHSSLPESKNRINLPGRITVRYELTDEGFKLEQLEPSNVLLKELCLGDRDIKVTLEKIKFAQAEEKLNRTLAHDQLHPQLKSVAQAVFDEAIKLYDNPQADKLQLATVLKATNHIIKYPTDRAYHAYYKTLAHQLRGFSWSKLIAGAMMVVLGAVLVAASTLVAVASFGVSTPLSAIGIKVGTSAVVSGMAIAVGAISVGAGVGGAGLIHKSKSTTIGKISHLADKMNDVNQQVDKSQGYSKEVIVQTQTRIEALLDRASQRAPQTSEVNENNIFANTNKK